MSGFMIFSLIKSRLMKVSVIFVRFLLHYESFLTNVAKQKIIGNKLLLHIVYTPI